MAKARPPLVAVLVALLLLGGGATWWTFAPSRSADDDAAARAASTSPPARPRRRAAAAPTAPVATPRADAPREEADWLERLARLVAEGATDEEALRAVLAEAGRGKAPGGGLHEVLRRSSEELAKAREESARRRAEDLVRWAIERALRPYREDRALFAKLYRELRFGEGRFDGAGPSLVRGFQFKEAARRMDELRASLRTWCYDALALRAADGFRRDAVAWREFGALCKRRQWDVPPAPDAPEARALAPSEAWLRYVAPHLDEDDAAARFDLVHLFVDLAETPAAAALVESGRRFVATKWADHPEYLERVNAYLAPAEEELRAIRALREGGTYDVPASAENLAWWFALHRPSLFAHAIGKDGDVELGAWDEAMTKSFLEGGLPWAPEQRQAERARVADARSESKDGLSGWAVRSPNWDAFTDVSAAFAGEATLVLESGWKQAQMATGIFSDHYEPVGARIFRYRDAYQSITHDRSGGHWVSGMNSVLTFLSDPDRTDFRQFRYPTLVHEATHAALAWGAGAVPSWMHEGLACFVARWSPVASVAANRQATRGWVRYGRALLAARDAKTLPTLDELVAIRSGWDADSFGPVTLGRYAAAESLLVWLDLDPARWKLVGDWIKAARKGVDPATTITPAQRTEIDKGWREFVEEVCAGLEAAK